MSPLAVVSRYWEQNIVIIADWKYNYGRLRPNYSY